MQAPKDVDTFLAQLAVDWQQSMADLREVMLETGLEEGIKWKFPVYSMGKKNVAGIFVTKAYGGIWFFQGALLSDPAGKLVNAQEGKTVALRQLRFATPAEVDLELVRAYVREAIENQQMGLEIRPTTTKETIIPPRLEHIFREQPAVKKAFKQFAPYKQREFAEHIISAKREGTKDKRLAKIIPLILAGTGLSDKYRK